MPCFSAGVYGVNTLFSMIVYFRPEEVEIFYRFRNIMVVDDQKPVAKEVTIEKSRANAGLCRVSSTRLLSSLIFGSRQLLKPLLRALLSMRMA